MDLLSVAGPLAGAALGLLKFISDAKDKITNCKKQVEQLEMTLKNVIPLIDKVKQFEEELDQRRSDMRLLIEQLNQGNVLVEKCIKIRPWNWYKRYRFTAKFIKLNHDLCRFFQLDMQAEIWTDTEQILVDMKIQLDERNRAENYAIPGVAGSRSAIAVPDLPALTVGMAVPLRELKAKLFQDNVSVVGLCAPGGCGKTTLAAKLCRDAKVKDKFKDNFCFLTVSSSPNLKAITQILLEKIADSRRMPEFQNDEDGFKRLEYFLKRMEPQPILVILDDVWSNEIVQKFTFRTTGYKILVTSRTHFESFESTYQLNMLGKNDARTLFHYWAIPGDGNYEEPDENLMKQVVEGCKGLPLALQVIGNSLCQQPERKWQQSARILSTGSSIFDTLKELLERLSRSLDFMESELQECFLDLGSFPQDCRIPAAALIDMWIELYGLDEDGAYVNLLELSLKSLVNLIESRSYVCF